MSKTVLGYNIGKTLGVGAYGKVKLGIRITDGSYAALKIHMKESEELTEKDIQ